LPSYDPDDLEEAPGEEQEAAEEQILDSATAAQTLAELEAEIAILKGSTRAPAILHRDRTASGAARAPPDLSRLFRRSAMSTRCRQKRRYGVSYDLAHGQPADRGVGPQLPYDVARDLEGNRHRGFGEEIATAVVWLCSPAASFMVGHAMTKFETVLAL
jgi:hypothetical protein